MKASPSTASAKLVNHNCQLYLQVYTVAKDGALVIWECNASQKEIQENIEMARATNRNKDPVSTPLGHREQDKGASDEEGLAFEGVSGDVADDEVSSESDGEEVNEDSNPVSMGTDIATIEIIKESEKDINEGKI